MKTGAFYEGEDFTGQGLDVHSDGIAYWFTAHAGKPLWLIIRSGKVLLPSGGAWNDPTTYSLEPIGTAEFKDNVFIYNTTLLGRGGMDLHLIVAGDERSGHFYDPRLNGSGFSILRFGDRIAMDWYTYDHGGALRWFSCIGYCGCMRIRELAPGARFRYTDNELLPAGSASLSANGTFKYTLDALGLSESGTMQLRRV